MKNHRDQIVHVLERLLALLEARVQQVSDSGYVSPQQPIGDVSQRLWHVRRGNFAGLHHLSLLFAERGPLARLANADGWTAQLIPLQQQFLVSFAALNRIRYHGTEQAVELGDHVQVASPLFFLRKPTGRVSYLPGMPRHNAQLDFGGLFWVGVQAHRFVAVHVDPDSLELRRTVKFLKHDAENVPPPPSEEELRE